MSEKAVKSGGHFLTNLATSQLIKKDNTPLQGEVDHASSLANCQNIQNIAYFSMPLVADYIQVRKSLRFMTKFSISKKIEV